MPKKPSTKAKLLSPRDWERAARAKLSRVAYDYFRSGADAEREMKRNVRAYQRWVVWYRVLVDVATRDLGTTVLGHPVAMPILIAPMAYQKLAHPEGELGAARAAAAVGTIYIASTLATTTLEDIAAATPAVKLFQLYVHKDREFTRELILRAKQAGYSGLVVTVDAPVLGRRLRDERNGFALPPGMTAANLASDSALAATEGSALASYVDDRHDASFSWKDLEWLRSLSELPVVLKGIVRVDDARRAVGHGIDGIIVSNHGGRQLDAAPATLDALPGIARAVGDDCEVYVDGGIRSGSDVFKALALGARAVLVGRPVLWALALEGEASVAELLRGMAEDLSRTMALAGTPTLADIRRDMLTPES